MSLADTGRALVEEAKRLPWWGWLLLAVAVYFGVTWLGNSSSGTSVDTSGDPTAGGDSSGSPLIPPNYPPGNEPGSPASGDPGTVPQGKPAPTGEPAATDRPGHPTSENAARGRPSRIRGGDPKAPKAKTPSPRPDPRLALQQQRQAQLESRGGTGGGPDSHVTRPGDTLHSIADLHGVDHEELYSRNRDVIEASARQRGLVHSDGGTWLTPGTRLELP